METQQEQDVTRQWQEHSLAHSCDTILRLGLASEEDLEIDCETTRQHWESGKGAEIIELHAMRMADEPTQVEGTVEHLSASIGASVVPQLLPAPFAAKLATPNGFYDKHPDLFDLAKALQCPILFNEDADVIGLGSINPITTNTFALAVQLYVESIQNIKPLISAVRLNYETWSTLCHRHFNR